jgi:hypothetical protein
MAKEGGMGIGEILLLAVGGYLVYSYFFATPAAATTTTTTTTGTAPPATTTTATPPPASTPTTPAPVAVAAPPQSPPAATPPAATTSIVGAVTTNVNNSLSANVNVNGTVTNVTIIYPALTAWNTSGVNVTAQLTALGVNVPALAQAMLTAYNTANPGNTFVSGLSGYQPFPFIWGRGMGQMNPMPRRPFPIGHQTRAPGWPTPRRLSGLGQNYVRPGAPMRRIG